MLLRFNKGAAFDYHVHTPKSDGVVPPPILFDAIKRERADLREIAFMDHGDSSAYDDYHELASEGDNSYSSNRNFYK